MFISTRLLYNRVFGALSVLFLLPGSLLAQSAIVKVEVPQNILQPGDAVEIRGDFHQATWDDGLKLQQSQKDNYWQSTISGVNTSIEYKYVIVRSNGQVEWESGSNRLYEGGGEIDDTIRGFEGEFLSRPTTVRIQVDLSGLTVNGHPIEKVAVMGERGPLSWELPDGATHMTQESENIWTASVPFPAGMPVDIPFKFAWQADGVWHWEPLPGHKDHLLLLDPNASEPTADYQYNTTTGRVEAAGATDLQQDNYAAATDIYGASRRYGYFRALELLEQGNFPAAREQYNAHRQHYDPVYIDDFDFLWATKLASQGQLDRALEFARTKMEQETNPWRKAYFRYLQGELLLNDGQTQAAIPHLEQALGMAPEDDTERLVEGYSHLALAMSYLQHEEADKRIRARVHFMALADRHPDPQMKRAALQNIVTLSRQTGNERSIEQAYERLIQTGSSTQRARSRIDRLEHRMEHLPSDSVNLELQWMEGTIADEALQQRLRLVKADHLLNQGRRGEAEQILGQLQSRTEHPASANRAKARLNSLRSTRGGN